MYFDPPTLLRLKLYFDMNLTFMLQYSLPECYKIKCNSPGIFPCLVFLVDFLFEILQQKPKKSPQKPQNVTVSIIRVTYRENCDQGSQPVLR